MRELSRETVLNGKKLIMPYFVVETQQSLREPITSMPGQYRFSLSELEREVSSAVEAGLNACLLFGIPAGKDALGTGAYAEDGIVQQAVRMLKRAFPHLLVVTDVCLCEYTDHGHCGMLSPSGEVLNDPSLELLAKAAVSHAAAGADIIAPSDMMDGRIAALRGALDQNCFSHIPLMSYAVKYASAYYGPFREAADSTPQSGDRKSYQMDPANRHEALREAEADAAEGADILMVKPAGAYLDIIRDVKDRFDLPLAAYQVSGEYSLIKAAGQMGWVGADPVALESLVGIARAGADMIITYFAQDLLQRAKI